MSKNTLLMPFIDESESFVYGFESGQIWEIIKQGEVIENRPCHLLNKKQIEMICELFRCDYRTELLDDTWIILNVFKTEV